MALGRFVLTANVTIPWPATWAEVIQGAANTPVAAPAVPATTVAADNATGVAVLVTVTGATVTAVTVNGTQAGTAAGGYVVPYPGTIALTYPSGTPTWTWAAAELPQSGSSSMTAAVSATAPAGGQAGTIMQFTFITGTAIYADSSGGTNGPCQLYAALGGSSNLRAFVDGQDDVGHAALSNLPEDAMIIQPPVLTTSPAGTTFATANTTGQTVNVSVSSNGATMANYWLSAVSVATSAAQYMIAVPAGGTVALQYTVAVPLWYWSVLTPAVPASTVAVTNTTGKELSVAAWGGTTTFWYVNGVQVATTTPAASAAPLALALPPAATISCTYSVAPVWTWMDYLDMAVLANSNGNVYAQMNSVAPTGVAGYSPLNTLPYAVHGGASMAGFCAGVSN